MKSSAEFSSLPVQYFDTDQARIAYRIVGAGPPLLFVHGWPLSGFTWRKMLPAASKQFTCLVIDLPGLGDTDWQANTDFSFPAQARRLRALIDHLGWSQYNLLAQDTGASIARFLALEDDRVRRFVLLNTEIPDHRLPWIPLYRLLSFVPGSSLGFRLLLGLRSFVRSTMGFGGSFVDLSLIDGEFHDRFIRPVIGDGRRLRGALRYLQGLDYPLIDTFRDRHKDIQADCLLVWGQDDPTFPEDLARAMAEQFSPAAGFVSIPGARLMVMEEKPDEVNHHALPFLAGR